MPQMVKHTQTICWQIASVFDHFVGLTLTGLIRMNPFSQVSLEGSKNLKWSFCSLFFGLKLSAVISMEMQETKPSCYGFELKKLIVWVKLF